MKFVAAWLDRRTGFKKLAHEALFENVPGGARWRYVWGSTLTFCIFVQFVTGIFLWMGYSPSAQTAWESVNYIQNDLWGGWLLRGIHHYTAQVMTVLLVLHLMQVVIDGAYKAPREVNFWFGLLLLLIVMGLSLTGYLLPWDQKGFWATKVATNIMGITPVIGHALQRILIGGTDYGHATLTRFFALHAGVLPGLLVLLVTAHVYLFRRHGLTCKEPKRRADCKFWPDQFLKDTVACLAVMAVVLFFIVRHRIFSPTGQLGAELGAPADPSEPYSAARPEWYFLFLFQFLKLFPAQTEIWGAIIIPSLVMLVLFLMPFIGKWKAGKWSIGHWGNLAFLYFLIAGAALLTFLSTREDAKNPTYVAAVAQADRDAERVKQLAASPLGVPTAGAVTLLHNDAFTQGPRLFAQHCASCHRHNGNNGMGLAVKDPETASDLSGFASRAWITGLLDPAHIAEINYFGGTKFKDGKMVKFVKKDVASHTPEQKEQLKKVIMALSAEAQLESQANDDKRDAAAITEGRTLLRDAMKCTDCHQFHAKDEEASAPDLTGYGSRAWLVKFLNDPSHPDLYGSRNDRMPSFGQKQILTPEQIGLLVDWLRGDWYEAKPAVETAKSP
jgi:ubiquinol-cytochrome c reductase cytochrome b subunit